MAWLLNVYIGNVLVLQIQHKYLQNMNYFNLLTNFNAFWHPIA